MVIEYILNQTDLFLQSKPKSERKQIGQFFTSKETAVYMSSLFEIPNVETIQILDPGAGSGILSVALVEHINTNYPDKKIRLTCYENNKDVAELLESNLAYLKKHIDADFNYTVVFDNYILSQSAEFNRELLRDMDPKKYDLVIGNPPYLKIGKSALEAQAMPDVCYGAPNLYFLFAAMSLFNLKDNGEMVYIIPRSWTSGAYFARFRDFLLTESRLLNIHLFVSRDKVFDKEEVLQETIIIRLKKTKQKFDTILISSSHSNKDFHNVRTLEAAYDVVISGKNNYVYLVTDQAELDLLKHLGRFTKTLPDLHLKMKTGLTVDFRNQEVLRSEPGEDHVPLFYSQHIQNGKVVFPIGKENEYITTSQRGLIQVNKNYLFVKRFTSKEESRRLQAGIYLADSCPDYQFISTQNKINFIDHIAGDPLCKEVVYGLYLLFNSSAYDALYRILNGSTQVNSTEINSLPFPDIQVIEELGAILYESGDLSTPNCDAILERIL